MRCDSVREIVEEGMKQEPAVQAHITSCSACKEYARRWEILRAGLVALREEEPPEPSVGFTTRLIRNLENASADLQFGQQFMDQIGRRMVYATLMVALTLLMVLLLPSSGPFRSSGVTESILVQAQASSSIEQVLGVGGLDSGDAAEFSSSSPAGYSSGGQGAR